MLQEDGKKRPSCEVKLHNALCNLLKELSPWETKLLSATKRLRTKLKHEWNDYEKRLVLLGLYVYMKVFILNSVLLESISSIFW